MKRGRGFSLVEALVALALISLVLGLVAQGFAKLSRINSASESASVKIELWSALQRLTSEVSGALTVTVVNPQELLITRVDPTLNVQYDEARERLPWPWPAPALLPPGVLEPNRPPFVVSVRFSWVSASGSIVQQLGAQSDTLVSGLQNWTVSSNPGDKRLLEIEFVPKQGSRTLHATAYLPMVAP